jgi:acetyl-CoA synthetase
MNETDRNDTYIRLHRHFGWEVPAQFNIAQVCCDRWAQGPDAQARVAVVVDGVAHGQHQMTYPELQYRAALLAGMLSREGVRPGDRVAIVMAQRMETAIAFMAIFRMGAIAVPLSNLFGPQALAYRLQDSGAAVAIADENAIDALQTIRGACPALRLLLGVGPAAGRADFDARAAMSDLGAAPDLKVAETSAETPALLIYTSGTTGQPKGALIPHRALIGNLPGFVCSQNWFGFDPLRPEAGTQAIFWSPADWAWTGGLMDALLPTLYFGRPIIASPARFDAERAYALMARHGVTHTFLFPTALKAMMKAVPEPRSRFELRLEGVMSAGEAVGPAVYEYCRDKLGLVVNEMFGQTEMNYIVGNCAMNGHPAVVGWPARPGSMGRPYPGHRVAVIDEAGEICSPGVIGEVALHRHDIHGTPDPVFFLGYWLRADATSEKFTGNWCRTGDLASCDEEGYLWYQGRADDVFKSSGYRIGPGEIENCLLRHPLVGNVAVVPKPDQARGAVVKAYVVLTPEACANRLSATDLERWDQDLKEGLQALVRGQLAPYEYPKEVEFIDQLPMTTTGKVQRRILRLQEEERALAARP